MRVCSLGGVGGGGGPHSVLLCNLVNIVLSWGHSRWCPAYAGSEQVSQSQTLVLAVSCTVNVHYWLTLG